MKRATGKTYRFKWQLMLFFVSVFQLVSAVPVIFKDGQVSVTLLPVFAGLIAAEWAYLTANRLISKRQDFELEMIAFLLSGISIVIAASINTGYAVKQLIAVLLGLAAHIVLLVILRNVDTAMHLRVPVAFASVGLLVLNLGLAKVTNGTLNWIEVAGFSIQPSEIVKIAFIFVGAVTLEKLQSTQSLTKYLVFSVACIGALFLMRDFGTALIFFFTFVVIAFMRSGDIRTLFFVSTGALLGAGLVMYFKPYVVTRFATYRRIWESVNEGGFQQTRVLIYTASGGLFGLGIGKGKLRDIYAASTDLVFGVICEEWGLLLGLAILTLYGFIAMYAIRAARRSSSTYYSIAAVASAGMLLFQAALNVYGITDLLPLTGVTLPFVSRGGTSMICSWALLAFIKSPDLYRQNNFKKTPAHMTMAQNTRAFSASADQHRKSAGRRQSR